MERADAQTEGGHKEESLESLKRKNADLNRASLKEQIRALHKRVHALEGAMDEIYIPANAAVTDCFYTKIGQYSTCTYILGRCFLFLFSVSCFAYIIAFTNSVEKRCSGLQDTHAYAIINLTFSLLPHQAALFHLVRCCSSNVSDGRLYSFGYLLHWFHSQSRSTILTIFSLVVGNVRKRIGVSRKA